MGYMDQALSLGKLALGQASPNPAVGAIIVRGDVIVGQGYTQPPGQAHAEVVALKQAGEQAQGGEMYVTLEPCQRYGRTPPCTDAIISSGISAVHVAMLDPNPLVSGKGKENLEAAGVKVVLGEQQHEARELNEAYIKYMTFGIPFITAKFAMSLDGKIATRSGDSRWISGDAARKRVHYLRYINDAIMAGINTVLQDNPHLTTRCCGGRGGTARKQPLRIIVDSKGRIPLNAQLLVEPGKTLIALGRDATKAERDSFQQVGAELIDFPSTEDKVHLERLLQYLGEKEITSILVEGGGTLLGSMFDLGLVDKVVAFISPIIIGGRSAKTAVAGRGFDKIADSIKLKEVTIDQLGDDLMLSGYVEK